MQRQRRRNAAAARAAAPRAAAAPGPIVAALPLGRPLLDLVVGRSRGGAPRHARHSDHGQRRQRQLLWRFRRGGPRILDYDALVVVVVRVDEIDGHGTARGHSPAPKEEAIGRDRDRIDVGLRREQAQHELIDSKCCGRLLHRADGAERMRFAAVAHRVRGELEALGVLASSPAAWDPQPLERVAIVQGELKLRHANLVVVRSQRGDGGRQGQERDLGHCETRGCPTRPATCIVLACACNVQ